MVAHMIKPASSMTRVRTLGSLRAAKEVSISPMAKAASTIAAPCASSSYSTATGPSTSSLRLSSSNTPLHFPLYRLNSAFSLPLRPHSSRSFSSTASRSHGGIHRPKEGEGIKVTFRDSKGQDIKTVEANEGDDLLSVAHEYDIDLEGACEGSIACSTCHVILEPDVYDQLEEPGDDENDMLDLAFGLTDTSRLGCQVKLTKATDGMVAQLPSATRNMRVDGAKAGHH